MAKPVVCLELTEKELRAVFEEMGKHPSIRPKVVDAMFRIRPLVAEANREKKAARLVSGQ